MKLSQKNLDCLISSIKIEDVIIENAYFEGDVKKILLSVPLIEDCANMRVKLLFKLKFPFSIIFDDLHKLLVNYELFDIEVDSFDYTEEQFKQQLMMMKLAA